MPDAIRIGLVAGEASGDLLGAGLIKSIRKRVPQAQFEGVAGPAMTAAGCEVLEPAESLAVFGLIEPLKEIPRLLRLRRSLVRRWCNNRPDVFVGIDAPDFNLGLELRLREHGIKTAQYVSPSVWAWRQYRVRKVARAVDAVLCLLPFEKTFYDDHDVEAKFVGHPMADQTPVDVNVEEIRRRFGIVKELVVAVLPGSRMGEVSRLGPVFAEVVARLAKDGRIGFVAPMANETVKDTFSMHLEDAGAAGKCVLIDGDAESAIAAADVVLLASGTATLQTALLGKPMVAAYKLAPLTHWIATRFNLVKVAHFSLPNLLTREPLVPEFLQNEASPAALTTAVSELLENPARRADISHQFGKLRTQLAQDANERAADAILELVQTV